MATRKTTKKQAPRGDLLVDAVIERVRAKAGRIRIAKPRPMAPALVETLRFSDGSELSPSMKRWLAFDASWLAGRCVDWDVDAKRPALEVCTIARLVHDHVSRVFAPAYEPLPSVMPQAKGIALDVGADSMRLLFLGERDRHGEYPVLWVDVDDTPCLGVWMPGFDVWLAVEDGLIADHKTAYRADIAVHEQANLGGREVLEAEGGSDDALGPPTTEDGERIAINPMTGERLILPRR